ncbi:unnamed protein product [Heligmosomoides polygyrus]|uniref:Secreted protein n=1 Tax=Heligmosomoides polygyrus TaxID=6339 RepID=A0A183F9P0_HELPZ|nr:unnamed protein product [Heligmosomoides polygyrus]
MRWCIAALVLFAIVGVVLSRKKVSAAERAFDKNEGIDWARSDEDGNDSGAEKAGKTTAKSVQYIIATESVTPETEAAAEKRAEDKDEGDAIIDLLSRVVDISNLTKHIEEEYLSSEEDALNRTDSFARTVLWIDASYKAEDFNLNVSALPECQAWQKFWSINTTRKDGKELNTTTEDQLSTDDLDLKETELVDKKKRMKQLGLNEELLKAFKVCSTISKQELH